LEPPTLNSQCDPPSPRRGSRVPELSFPSPPVTHLQVGQLLPSTTAGLFRLRPMVMDFCIGPTFPHFPFSPQCFPCFSPVPDPFGDTGPLAVTRLERFHRPCAFLSLRQPFHPRDHPLPPPFQWSSRENILFSLNPPPARFSFPYSKLSHGGLKLSFFESFSTFFLFLPVKRNAFSLSVHWLLSVALKILFS